MTKNEIFYILENILIKANQERASETISCTLHEISKLPTDCRCYFVASDNDDILCTDKDMAMNLWENNSNFKEVYWIDICGACHTIKNRR